MVGQQAHQALRSLFVMPLISLFMQLYETRSLQRRFRKDALLNKYLSDERAQSSKINFSDLNWHEVDIQVLDWIWSSDFVHRDRGMYVRALTRRWALKRHLSSKSLLTWRWTFTELS